jgi:hypothetical protein
MLRENETPAALTRGRGERDDEIGPQESTSRKSNWEEAHHFLDNVDLLDDWRCGLVVQVKRAELLHELGLLDEQAMESLTRRVGIWRLAVSAMQEQQSKAERERCAA